MPLRRRPASPGARECAHSLPSTSASILPGPELQTGARVFLNDTVKRKTEHAFANISPIILLLLSSFRAPSFPYFFRPPFATIPHFVLFHRRGRRRTKKNRRECTEIGIVFVFVSDSIVYYVYAHKLPFPTPVAFSLCVARNVNSLRHLPRTNFASGRRGKEKKNRKREVILFPLVRFVSFARFGVLFADGGEYIRAEWDAMAASALPAIQRWDLLSCSK